MKHLKKFESSDENSNEININVRIPSHLVKLAKEFGVKDNNMNFVFDKYIEHCFNRLKFKGYLYDLTNDTAWDSQEYNELQNEGKLMKSKSVDSDVKKEQFRDKVNSYVKSQDCKTKKVGDDFEIHFDGEHIAQVMFRDDYIGVKKEGNKFPKEFKYDEFGKIKKELSEIIKSFK